ncbi:Rid family detoxifying hydrolase [Criblamydia sequanensis]|uniref:Endoribonuclease n=1 Tax=Candidatus Criblamydia sequanensis CRIB-18 TaxID=1437425 RepID=A0A090E2L6_9BACT|nr:Rid family detoxifying hydrolase [Criblamydia sequanensis]CDR34889.1 Endoribonuclease [Criblamydia sequanensis CRIB-18]
MTTWFKKILIASLIASSPICADNGIHEIRTLEAPQVIGPYSQAVRAGQYLFVSGQLALDPMTNMLIGSTIEEQTLQVLNNIEAILRAQNLSLKDIVKSEVYLKDMKDFKGMNSVYAEKFSNEIKPARQAMQVAKLPLDALVEISCVAFISN